MKRLNIIRRSASSDFGACRPWPKPKYGPARVQRSELMNGIKLVTVHPSETPMAACTIMYQAGSSYEHPGLNQLGVTHFLRAASSTSSLCYSGFAKLRVLQQYAAELTCTSDRQSIAYTLKCMPYDFSALKGYLSDTAVRSTYNNWEIDDLRQMIFDDNHRITPEQRCIDLAQKACWRGPLSQSIYCNPDVMDQIDGETLTKYTRYHFKTDHCTVAGNGVHFDDLMKMAEKIEVCRDKPTPRCKEPSFPRAGFEYYDLGPGSDTWLCAMVPSCRSGDPGLLDHAIIAAACNTNQMRFGVQPLDRTVHPSLATLTHDPFTEFRVFNISYQDDGVFGIISKMPACSARDVAKSTVDFLKCLPDLMTPAAVQMGKNRLKISLALHDEECTNVTEGFASQLANNMCLDSISDMVDFIDSATNAGVMRAAKNLCDRCSNQMAIAVVGDVAAVPHDKELRY